MNQYLKKRKQTLQRTVILLQGGLVPKERLESQHVIKGTRGMKIPGLVEGMPLEFQIDIGAINTFIPEDTYYIILPEIDLFWSAHSRSFIRQMVEI